MAHESSQATTLPESTAWLFPEYNFAGIDVRKHRHVIMERILERGDWSQVNWLFDHYHERGVRDWVRRWGFRSLSRRSFALWKLVLDIQRFEAPAWALETQAERW
ncbi:MAG: hypothetical protein K1X65_07055 [Caldilineales bacterium]|nr:hypothetical protein [Caldilineales bacterium]